VSVSLTPVVDGAADPDGFVLGFGWFAVASPPKRLPMGAISASPAPLTVSPAQQQRTCLQASHGRNHTTFRTSGRCVSERVATERVRAWRVQNGVVGGAQDAWEPVSSDPLSPHPLSHGFSRTSAQKEIVLGGLTVSESDLS